MMDFPINYNLAGMEFQYALGLVGLFVMVLLLGTGIYYGVAEPVRKRRLINQRSSKQTGTSSWPRFFEAFRKPMRAWF